MRNIVQYPITAKEVKETIQREIDRLSKPNAPIGGVQGLIWQALLKTLDVQLDKDLYVVDLVLEEANI